jgi:hypothetical protein
MTTVDPVRALAITIGVIGAALCGLLLWYYYCLGKSSKLMPGDVLVSSLVLSELVTCLAAVITAVVLGFREINCGASGYFVALEWSNYMLHVIMIPVVTDLQITGIGGPVTHKSPPPPVVSGGAKRFVPTKAGVVKVVVAGWTAAAAVSTSWFLYPNFALTQDRVFCMPSESKIGPVVMSAAALLSQIMAYSMVYLHTRRAFNKIDQTELTEVKIESKDSPQATVAWDGSRPHHKVDLRKIRIRIAVYISISALRFAACVAAAAANAVTIFMFSTVASSILIPVAHGSSRHRDWRIIVCCELCATNQNEDNVSGTIIDI